MYFVAKWMLLRVCKSPAGLARRISNLAQSLLRVVIFIYWLGKVLLTYINLNEDQKAEYDSIFGYMFRNAFGYVEFILAILCLLFLEFFVKWMSKFILRKSNEIKGSKIS
jgi:putative exporter of polyketide antibiotics